jgi:hypothetical protein
MTAVILICVFLIGRIHTLLLREGSAMEPHRT